MDFVTRPLTHRPRSEFQQLTFSPTNFSPVGLLKWILYALLAAKIGDRFATSLHIPIIVDDYKTTHRQLWIEINQTVHGGFIHVAIQTYQSQLLDRCRGQGVLEPAFKKFHLVVQ